MRKEKALLTTLNNLVKLLSEEAGRNAEFANQLDRILAPIPAANAALKKKGASGPTEIPDVYSELSARGEVEFRLWLRNQPVRTLYAIIRRHDLDASRRSFKWKDPEKLSAFIADQLRSRLARGSGFLSGSEQAR
jgi:hypothetical protein